MIHHRLAADPLRPGRGGASPGSVGDGLVPGLGERQPRRKEKGTELASSRWSKSPRRNPPPIPIPSPIILRAPGSSSGRPANRSRPSGCDRGRDGSSSGCAPPGSRLRSSRPQQLPRPAVTGHAQQLIQWSSSRRGRRCVGNPVGHQTVRNLPRIAGLARISCSQPSEIFHSRGSRGRRRSSWWAPSTGASGSGLRPGLVVRGGVLVEVHELTVRAPVRPGSSSCDLCVAGESSSAYLVAEHQQAAGKASVPPAAARSGMPGEHRCRVRRVLLLTEHVRRVVGERDSA